MTTAGLAAARAWETGLPTVRRMDRTVPQSRSKSAMTGVYTVLVLQPPTEVPPPYSEWVRIATFSLRRIG
jgi:hypothetical protein